MSSGKDRKSAESALLISLTVASTCSDGATSSLAAAAFARHSINPGSSNLVHCFKIGLPVVDAIRSVFAQCAAVKES